MNDRSVHDHGQATSEAFIPVVEVTATNLKAEVLEASQHVPVLLDIWAEWCAPCKAQLPILMKLVEDYQGKFRLAKLNAEDPDPATGQMAQQLMMQLQVRSIPTLVMIHQGQPVKVLTGLQKESDLRALLDELTMSPAELIQQQIDQLIDAGQPEQALGLLQQVLEDEPGNTALQVLQAKLLLQLGRIDDARKVIAALPDDAPGAGQPKAKLAFLDMAEGLEPRPVVEQKLAADESDLEARYQLAVHQVLDDNEEAAFESLLLIVRKDRSFRDDGARLLMLKIFEQKGAADPVVRRYRNRLFSLMH
ncbi:tetratricopeptide repeat protein [Sansalvadorimonas verongulae]|uniref:tetratricopeptide repeat protein n=1 Tax=Sansalvadorimonas verongulae TaxID=2172824 RepID=UPI0012BBA82D|nr:tetratricopeptide repeat protein [Sansalvadorimonas verongulae]MTI15166.1 tetratricopeptide repeat protein [Sansalvadorimonas verongulae]